MTDLTPAQARALIAAANLHLTDDPDAHARRIDPRTLAAGADALAPIAGADQ